MYAVAGILQCLALPSPLCQPHPKIDTLDPPRSTRLVPFPPLPFFPSTFGIAQVTPWFAGDGTITLDLSYLSYPKVSRTD